MKRVDLARPLAAVLLLGALLGTAALGVWMNWADLGSAIEERDAQADLLARGVLASKRAALDPTGSHAADPFVPGATATLAAAQIDATMRAAAADTGSALLSSRAEAKANPGDLPGRIEAQVVFEGTNEPLQAVLLRLETGTPLVFVDALTIEPADTNESGGGGGDAAGSRLRMSLTVSAYWRPQP